MLLFFTCPAIGIDSIDIIQFEWEIFISINHNSLIVANNLSL